MFCKQCRKLGFFENSSGWFTIYNFFSLCKHFSFFLNGSSSIQIVEILIEGIPLFQNLKLKQTFYVFWVPAASIMATTLYNPFHKQVIALEAASDPPFSVFTLTTIGKLLLNLALWADGNLPCWICINVDLCFMDTRCFKPYS